MNMPAHLWIGSPADLTQKTITFLQNELCKSACKSCTICIHVAQQQHHSVTWLTPEKQYTLDALSVIFNTISFQLDVDQKHFFVIQHADFLTPVCANALLKPIEEPPAGYQFILLAQRKERILPTIRSRCSIQHYISTEESEYDYFLCHFTKPQPTDAQQFLSDLEKAKPSERTSIEWLDSLLTFWIYTYKKACTTNNVSLQEKSIRRVALLKSSYQTLPMPGSAKLFWKNLFLQFKK